MGFFKCIFAKLLEDIIMSLRTLTATAALALLPLTANAAVLNISFEGFVESTNDGANVDVASIGDLNVDDLVTGSFLLDTSSMNGVVGSDAFYADVVSNFVLNIDGYSYTSALTGNARVRNNHMAGTAAPLRDMFIATVGGATGPSQGGLAPSLMQFSLGGTDALAVLDDVDAPSIAEFFDLFNNDNNNGNTKFLSFADGSDVRYDVTSLTIAAVPLPASSLLLLAGVGGLVAAKRRKS